MRAVGGSATAAVAIIGAFIIVIARAGGRAAIGTRISKALPAAPAGRQVTGFV